MKKKWILIFTLIAAILVALLTYLEMECSQELNTASEFEINDKSFGKETIVSSGTQFF